MKYNAGYLGVLLICVGASLLQAARVEPNMAFKFKNKSGQKVHMLLIQSNDFRHLLDAGGWTNKVVKSLLDVSEEVLTVLPDIEKQVKEADKKDKDQDKDGKDSDTVKREQYEKAKKALKEKYDEKAEAVEKKYANDDDAKDRELENLKKSYDAEKAALRKKYGIEKAKKPAQDKDKGIHITLAPVQKAKITKDDVRKMETWLTATRGVLSAGGQFVGDILPHVALAAIRNKDYFTQVYPGVTVYAYKSSGKSPTDKVMHLKNLTVAIFPDDQFGVAKFDTPLFVRSFDAEKYNTVYYGPEDGHAAFRKTDPKTGDVLKETEKRFLPLKYNKKEGKVEIPDEGDDVLDDIERERDND